MQQMKRELKIYYFDRKKYIRDFSQNRYGICSGHFSVFKNINEYPALLYPGMRDYDKTNYDVTNLWFHELLFVKGESGRTNDVNIWISPKGEILCEFSGKYREQKKQAVRDFIHKWERKGYIIHVGTCYE